MCWSALARVLYLSQNARAIALGKESDVLQRFLVNKDFIQYSVPWELLYADDLAVIAGTLEE